MHFRLAWMGILLSVCAMSVHSGRAVTFDVDLDKLRGQEFLDFVDAAVPEVHGDKSRQPLNLPTLAILQSRLTGGDREFKRQARAAQRAVEELMRRELAKCDMPTLRRLALGDGKSDPGNPLLKPALYLRLIEAEVSAVCAKPPRALAFPA